jgi:hypothetical protein
MDTCSRLDEPGGAEWKGVNVGRLRTITSGKQLIGRIKWPLDRIGGQGTWPARFCIAAVGGATWGRAGADGGGAAPHNKAVPKELEECARIDGASRWQAMLYIVIPVAIPGILSAGIFAFTLSWNEFIYALVFLSSPEQKTGPVGVTSELIRGDVFFWGPLMAGALLGSIPLAIAYSFFVEHYVAGLTGSVKG